jgi:hypothetical protein
MMYLACASVILVIILIILAVGFGTGSFSDDGSGGETTDKGTPGDENIPTFAPDPNEPERYTRLREYLTTVGANGEATFVDPVSPESQALAWMQTDDPAQLDPIEPRDLLRIDQRYALLTIWFQSDLQWFNETNWLSEDECSWFGVTCFVVTPSLRRSLGEDVVDDGDDIRMRKLQDGDKLVALVDLEQNNLQGNVPPDLYLLQFLKTLNLSSNRMTGSLPSTIGQMTYLEELYLDNNDLGGQMDLDFSGIADMRVIDISSNRISGTIPDSLWNATSLQEIHLDGNVLSGTISDSAVNLQSLGKYVGGNEAILWLCSGKHVFSFGLAFCLVVVQRFLTQHVVDNLRIYVSSSLLGW